MNRHIVHESYGWGRHGDLVAGECAKRGIELCFYVYSSLAFLKGCPPAHFARDEEGRPHTGSLECETRLCLAQEDGVRRFGDGVERYLEERAGARGRVLPATADGYGLCRCPRCRGLDAARQWQPLFELFVDRAQGVLCSLASDDVFQPAVEHCLGAILIVRPGGRHVVEIVV